MSLLQILASFTLQLPIVCYNQINVKDILTVSEAAGFLKKHPDTIRRWIKTKKLVARKISAGKNGIFVILRSDLLEVVISNEIKAVRRAKKAARKLAAKSPQQVKLPI